MDESVLIAYDMARRPPVFRVAVDAFRGEQVAEAPGLWRIVFGEKLEPVHVLEIPGQSAFAAINLKGVAVPSSQSKAGCLETADRPAGKVGHHQRRILHFDRAAPG